jgi:hypothetical protein
VRIGAVRRVVSLVPSLTEAPALLGAQLARRARHYEPGT